MRSLQIVHSDAIAFLRSMSTESVDLVISDFPYESLEKHREVGTTTRLKVSDSSSNPWFDTVKNAYLVDVLVELYRVLKKKRHCYLYADDETEAFLRRQAEKVGFYVWKSITWVKTCEEAVEVEPPICGASHVAASQVRVGTGYHYGASTERILFLEKRSLPYFPPDNTGEKPRLPPPGEGRQLSDMGSDLPAGQAGDVFFAPRVRGGYPTEKPVSNARVMVSQSTMLGEIVLDPFCGSGSTGEAAIRLSRKAIMVDSSEVAINRTTGRLEHITDFACDHPRIRPPKFAIRKAAGMTRAEVQNAYPRTDRLCPACGERVVRYASEAHRLAGGW